MRPASCSSTPSCGWEATRYSRMMTAYAAAAPRASNFWGLRAVVTSAGDFHGSMLLPIEQPGNHSISGLRILYPRQPGRECADDSFESLRGLRHGNDSACVINQESDDSANQKLNLRQRIRLLQYAPRSEKRFEHPSPLL